MCTGSAAFSSLPNAQLLEYPFPLRLRGALWLEELIEAFDVKKFKREMTTNYPKLVKQTELFLQDWLELTGLAS